MADTTVNTAAGTNAENIKNTLMSAERRNEIYSKYSKYFEDNSQDLANVDTFYKLLLAEMTNQDPMEPTSNTEFVSQLASFSSLQTMSNVYKYQLTSYAAGLAGKVAHITDPTGDNKDGITGVIESVDISDTEDIKVVVGGKKYDLKNVQMVNGGTNVADKNSLNLDGTYANSLIGKYATVLENNVLDKGFVNSVEMEDGRFRVVINGYSYDVSSVVSAEAYETDDYTVDNDGAYATSLIGKKVTIEDMNDNGDIIDVNGVVESITMENGRFKVVVNGYPYSVGAVIRVQNASAASAAEEPEDSEKTESVEETAKTETQPLDPDDETVKADTTKILENTASVKAQTQVIPEAEEDAPEDELDIPDLVDTASAAYQVAGQEPRAVMDMLA